jgi:hypothetical protein
MNVYAATCPKPSLQAISEWFNDLVAEIDHGSAHGTHHVRGIFGKPWTAREVYRVRHEAHLKKRTTEEHGHAPGTTKFVGRYQQIISDDFKAMEAEDPDQLQELQNEADEWNRARPPKEQQRK